MTLKSVECVMNICLLGTFFLSLQKNWDAKYITKLLLGPSNIFLGCEILQRLPHPNNQDTQGLVLPVDGIVRCNESLNFWFNIDFWINHCLINQLLLFLKLTLRGIS